MPKLNYKNYEKYVSNYGMTEKEQRALIEAVWKLVEVYADNVFGNMLTVGESNQQEFELKKKIPKRPTQARKVSKKS